MSPPKNESTDILVDLKHEGTKSVDAGLSEKGIRTMQGCGTERVSAGRKGSDFEQWAKTNVFHGEGHRLVALPEDNEHLDKYGDGLGLTKGRRSDSYIMERGEIWELKSGYEKGGIDQQQLLEYSIMEDAGHVNIRTAEGQLKVMPVKSINYLFETKDGAAANMNGLRGQATAWYKNNEGQVHLYAEDA